jgi:hypothetical protein
MTPPSPPPTRYVAEVGVNKAFGGLGDAKLGLNAVGGSSALSVARALGSNAKLVTYGSMCAPPPCPAPCRRRPVIPVRFVTRLQVQERL